MCFFKKIFVLSEKKRRFIFWIAWIGVVIVCFLFWQNHLKKILKEETIGFSPDFFLSEEIKKDKERLDKEIKRLKIFFQFFSPENDQESYVNEDEFLEELKRWYEKGIISEEEFKEILFILNHSTSQNEEKEK